MIVIILFTLVWACGVAAGYLDQPRPSNFFTSIPREATIER